METKTHPVGPLELLILQATPFCNLNCRYCYLSSAARANPRKMSLETVGRILESVYASGLVRKDFTLSWHAGEPLVMPMEFYRGAVALTRRLESRGFAISHNIQTNATLLTDEWAAFLRENRFQVGVSIDGPAFLHDLNRVTRQERGTWHKAVAGIRRLNAHGVPFSVISVLTRRSLDCPDELYEFYRSEDIRAVAFNIEEIEGARRESSLNVADVRARFEAFLGRFYDLCRRGDHPIHVREIDPVVENLAHEAHLGQPMNLQVRPFSILCFDHAGNFSGFSPELIGNESREFDDFLFGRSGEPILSALEKPSFLAMRDAIAEGVRLCAERCAYFDFCGGGAPINKLFENGSFASDETLFCKLNVQAKVDVIRRKLAPRTPAKTAEVAC